MPSLVDLTGKKLGRLTVLKKVERPENLKKRAAYWLCRCDCGNEKIFISSSLIDYGKKKGGDSISRSCGCLQKDIARKRIYDKVDGNPAENRLMGIYKNSAKKRDYDFGLTKKQFMKIATGNCRYCGCEPSRVAFNSIKTISLLYNGVDRLDNNKGYTLDNCVPCCTHCNKAKLDKTEKEFEKWIINAYNKLMERRNEFKIE